MLPGPADLPSRLRSAAAAEREGVLVAFLREQVRSVLRLPSLPSAEVGFFDLGMDSLMAAEFQGRLNRALAGEYKAPSTVVFRPSQRHPARAAPGREARLYRPRARRGRTIA